MKSYNVKSNAKRFAKQLVAKHPEYIAVEPVEITEGARAWFPAVAAPTKVIAKGIPEEIGDTAYVNGQPAELAAERIEGHTTLKGGEEGEPTEAVTFYKHQQPGMSEATPTGVAMTMTDMQAAVADLPATKSTREEIEARRAARRERIEAEGQKPAKLTKAATIVALVSRDGGATQEELEAATSWQRHTLRGYIAGTLRKRGHNIVAKKIKGEATRYVIEGGAQ